MAALSLKSPVGNLVLTEDGGHIVSLAWGKTADGSAPPVLKKAKRQLEEYFAGERRTFDLPLDPKGTPYMRRIWRALRRIKWGKTMSYGELAVLTESTARIVGQACAKNPVPIIIPCHRVLAKGGALGGYSGGKGVETKCALLRLEGALL